MALNFSTLVYLPCQDAFGRDLTIHPCVSLPNTAPYYARGIFNTRDVTVQTEMGLAILSDQETILDIREIEFANISKPTPVQGDIIDIPQDSESGVVDGIGTYEVTDVAWNGGGEVTLRLRKWDGPIPTHRAKP
jgi:hypothetical protein